MLLSQRLAEAAEDADLDHEYNETLEVRVTYLLISFSFVSLYRIRVPLLVESSDTVCKNVCPHHETYCFVTQILPFLLFVSFFFYELNM